MIQGKGRNKFRYILGNSLKKNFRTRGIDERDHHYEFGQLETDADILKECSLHSAEQDLLRKVSPELDPKIRLDTKKGLLLVS